MQNTQLKAYFRSPYFSSVLFLKNNASILRVVQQGKRNSLVKFNNGNLSQPFYLEQQGDGIFSTDGMLLANSDNSRIFYINYYRNQFLALDTGLRLFYKGKTIDTVSRSKIRVKEIESEQATTIANPQAYVNRLSAINDKWLFINSALKADNETDAAFEGGAVIDVYSVENGKYSFSFYIPRLDGQRLRDFKVYGDLLLALYDTYLYLYRLKF